jgi:hypothetical protein
VNVADDLATILSAEMEIWFQNLSVQGIIPRAFTGATKGGSQAIVILNDLPLDHVQRRHFLIWLCRTEEFIAYAYATQVQLDSLDIYASSDHYDATLVLGINRSPNGSHNYYDRHRDVLPSDSSNGLFRGLHRSKQDIASEDEKLFARLWQELKPISIWRRRAVSPS